MPHKLAFIGTGIMGLPMAGHLLSTGHQLTVSSRTKSRAEPLLAKGAQWADTPRAAAEAANVVFMCVSDTPDVQAVVLGEKGIIHAAREGLIVVDHSTISPAATRAMAAELAKKNTPFLDAPISGGDVGAKNGTLSIIVGGEESAFNQVRPLLETMGKTITHCGPSGTGQLTKLVNQILAAGNLLAISEALNFAQRNGLDLPKTIHAVAGGAAGSWLLANLGPRMAKGDLAPGFMIDLQQKDLRLVLEAAGQALAPVPAAALVHQLFTAAQAAGHGRDGTQALFTVLQRLAGAE